MTTDQFEVLNANLQPNIHLTKKLNKLLETRLDNDKVCLYCYFIV